MLHALEVPPYGGDTIFASQTLAYERCSPALQAMLAGLDGVHSAVNAYSPKMQAVHDTFAGMSVQTDDTAHRTQVHPVVRVHGETGEPALFVNAQYTVGLHGFMPHEAQPLLDYLFAHSTRTDLHLPVAVARRRRRDLGQPLGAAHGHGRLHRAPARDAPHHRRGRGPDPGGAPTLTIASLARRHRESTSHFVTAR